jgi:choline dehydrogenase-like flavoprotein
VALADALFPPDGPPPGGSLPGAAAVGAGARAVELLERLPWSARRGLMAELALLEHGARLRRGRPFSEQPRHERERIFSRLDRLGGSLSDAVTPLKLIPLLAYLSKPEVLAAIGIEQGALIPPAAPLPAARPLPVRAHPGLRPGFSEVFDVVIVGSGAGGAPVARTLARAGWSVAVVDEGDAFTRDDFVGPEVDRMHRLYRDGGATMTLGRPPVLMPIGKAVGGSTVINSGTCLRPPDGVVASWRRDFGIALHPDDLVPYYEDVERTLGVAPVPWEVMGNNGKIAARGAEALGIPGRPLTRNAAGCRGSGVCAAGCPTDGKRGVHLNYLPQAIEGGAEIFARCRVDRILTRGGRAVGVKGKVLSSDGRVAGDLTLHARRGVVVAAGAPFTPGLLARSGHRSRGMGGNLRIHPDTAVVGMFDERVDGWRGVMQSYLIDALSDRGILLEATFPPPGLGYAEAGMRLTAAERKNLLARMPNMAVIGTLVSDTSSGRVRSLGPGRTPLMSYSVGRLDARRTLDGMLLAARVLFAAGATEVYPLLTGAGVLRTPAEAEECLGRRWPSSALRLSAYHPMGTVRMGSDPRGLLDDAGRVRGAERLVVSDASVFPTSLAVNPQVTIMAFATRAADRILESW